MIVGYLISQQHDTYLRDRSDKVSRTAAKVQIF